jgi:hypothetical protein
VEKTQRLPGAQPLETFESVKKILVSFLRVAFIKNYLIGNVVRYHLSHKTLVYFVSELSNDIKVI